MSIVSLMVTADHAVPVEPQGGTATVTVLSGGPVFYADNQQVSSASNQGQIALSGSQSFSSPAWIISSSVSSVQVSQSGPSLVDVVLGSDGGVGGPGGTALTASVVSVGQVHTNSIPGNAQIALTSPIALPVLSGQFTPDAATVLVDIDISHTFVEPFNSTARWILYWGPTGEGQLTPTLSTGVAGAPLAPVAAGASYVMLGSVGSFAGMVHASVLLSGLTPGTPVAYEISVDIIGGFERMSVANQPGTIDYSTVYPEVSNPLTGLNDRRYWGAIRYTDTGAVQLLNARHWDRYEDVPVGSPLAVGGVGQGSARMSPNGVYCVVANRAQNSVSVITTGALTGAAPAIQGTYTPPGTTPKPNDVVCTPDNTSAWIGLWALGQVVKMTLATGAFGTAVNVGGINGDPGGGTSGRGGLAISSDGAFVYAACYNAAKIYKVNTATSAVTSCSTPKGCQCLALSPDNLTVYAFMTQSADGPPYNVYAIQASDMTLQRTVAVAKSAEAAQCFPDGKSLIYLTTDSSGGAEVQQLNLPSLTRVAFWPNTNGSGGDAAGQDICINPNGAIYVTDNANKGINLWPTGQVNFRGIPYWPNELRIRATPCSA